MRGMRCGCIIVAVCFLTPETPCKATGSFMRLLWDAQAGRISASSFADRVLLAQAGVQCVGGKRDEVLVEEVTTLLENTTHGKMRPKLDSGNPQREDEPQGGCADAREQGQVPIVATAAGNNHDQLGLGVGFDPSYGGFDGVGEWGVGLEHGTVTLAPARSGWAPGS